MEAEVKSMCCHVCVCRIKLPAGLQLHFCNVYVLTSFAGARRKLWTYGPGAALGGNLFVRKFFGITFVHKNMFHLLKSQEVFLKWWWPRTCIVIALSFGTCYCHVSHRKQSDIFALEHTGIVGLFSFGWGVAFLVANFFFINTWNRYIRISVF